MRNKVNVGAGLDPPVIYCIDLLWRDGQDPTYSKMKSNYFIFKSVKRDGFVAIEKSRIDAILKKYENPEESLIAVLQDVQAVDGYISRESVEYITEISGIPSARIMGVASFYAGFRLKPVGKYRIMVCMGTACHVNGAERVGDTVKRVLGIEEGDVTEDGLFSWEEVACLGCCSISPAMMINDTAYGKLTPDKVTDIINSIREGENK